MIIAHYFIEHGLKATYENDPYFSHLLRMFRALAFVPTDKVRDYYDELINSARFEPYRDQLLDYCTYFTNTYLGVPPNEARFKIPVWNLYQR